MKTTQSILVGALLFLGGCDKAPAPVASVSIDPANIQLSYPGFAAVEVTWQIDEPLADVLGDPLVFVHLLDAEGNVERTFDHPLPFSWQPGSTERYELMLYQSALAPPLESGSYRLSLGLYEAGGKRWALSGSGEEVAGLEYHLATVVTQGDPSVVPMFYFSPSWLPLEAGTDVQILGRRWLTDEGTIRVAEIPAPGTIWMQLQLSKALAGVEEMSFLEGETEARVDLTSTCDGAAATFSGFGVHEAQVRVAATDDGALASECEIVLRPNYQIVEIDTLSRRSVGLQILSWVSD